MAEVSPAPLPPTWQSFLVHLDGGAEPEGLLEALEREGLLERALDHLKRAGRGPACAGLRGRLAAAVAAAREKRLAQWQRDPRRRAFWLRYEVRGSACALHPPALQSALARALLDAGLPLAMGLEKTPRPALRLGPPLPLGAEGLSEWADADFREPPGPPLEALPALASARCPEGLRFLEFVPVPTYASPVMELAREAHWRWVCPELLRAAAQARTALFLAAERFQIEKTGKAGGQKVLKSLEVRALVRAMGWEDGVLGFSTGLASGEALNPRKLLAGILGLDAEAVQGIVRLRVDLAPDPRQAQAEKYQPKLRNIYEDAVLLEAGGNITLVDEDEDEDEEPVVIEKKRH